VRGSETIATARSLRSRPLPGCRTRTDRERERVTQVSGAAGSADQRLRKLTEPEDPPPNRRISLIVRRLVPPTIAAPRRRLPSLATLFSVTYGPSKTQVHSDSFQTLVRPVLPSPE